MKKSELQQIIKEEINKALKESSKPIYGGLNMQDLQDRDLEIKFQKFGIGYSWTDMYGKEKYEEGTFEDARDYNEILKSISEEIAYQEENRK